ncbi:unnamed protein product, partial [Brassica oleracea var. botrytis]
VLVLLAHPIIRSDFLLRRKSLSSSPAIESPTIKSR